MNSSRSNILFFLSIAVVIALILLMAWKVSAVEPYGVAQYYRSDAWNRSGLKAHWLTMDVGVRGDVLQDDGDFEIFTGAEGGCTNCAAEWTCDCTSAGGGVDQDTTHLYNFDSSSKLDATGYLHSLIYRTITFDANKCYLATFCYRGQDGTEDLLLYAGNPALTDSYNFATDAWTGAYTDLSLADIGTTWTCSRAYINVGTTAKSNYAIALASDTADGTAIYVDYVRLYELRSCDVDGKLGNALAVSGDPLFGHSEVLMPRVGTGPAGNWGMKADGVDDFLLCTDADCAMDPILWESTGAFSIGCRMVTDTVAAGTMQLISKYGGAGNRSWAVNRGAANLVFIISDDGTNIDSNSVGMFTVNTLHSFVSTLDPSGGSGACTNNFYYDAYQTDTDATLTECAPFDSNADLQVGALGGSFTWSGSILECALWDGELSAIEANKFISPYYPGNANGDGFYVHTCSQAAAPAVCSTQKCRNAAPNTCQAEGSGVMAAHDQGTELLENNAWQQITSGDDSAPDFTDWTETRTPGDGTATITVYRADSIYGHAARLKTTGTTSEARLRSECMAATSSTVYTAYLKAKRLTNEVVDFSIVYFLYSDGACANQTAWGYVVSSTDLTEVWEEYLGTFTTAADTNSIRIQFPYYRSTADYLVDAASVKAGSYRKPWVHNPVGTTTYTARNHRLDSPLARFDETTQKLAYEDGWCVSACVYTDHTTDSTVHRALNSGTVSNQFWSLITNDGSDNISFAVTTGVGAWKSIYQAVTPSTWVAGTRKFVTSCTDNASPANLKARWYETSTSTWYTISDPSSGGGSTGQMTTQSDELHVGHKDGSDFLDGYVIGIWLSEYSAIFPMEGFEECKNFSQPPY